MICKKPRFISNQQCRWTDAGT